MGQMAMGMPFQVLPPPPPPMKENKQKLTPPQSNGNARKSPQSFEPPPMGCRPEIKIPENPMATLRKVPRPQAKDNFWVEEFIQEHARNSEPEDSIRQQIASSPQIQQQQQQEQARSNYDSLQTKPTTPVNALNTPLYTPKMPSPERQEINIPIRNVKLEDVRTPSPTRVFVNQSSQQPPSSSSPVTVSRNFETVPQFQQPQTRLQQQIANNQPQQQGGRIILSTMPNRPTQQAQQHVSFPLS